MYKIAISGKARTGKNTLARLLSENILQIPGIENIHHMAFADAIKEMICLMFPQANREYLYGPSELRNNVVPGVVKDGSQISYRKLLIDLGSLGRGYDEDVWIKSFNFKLNDFIKNNKNTIICTDVRFINEFNYLRELDFFMIRIERNNIFMIDDTSETEQESISNDKFNYVINNNGSVQDLYQEVKRIIEKLKQQ